MATSKMDVNPLAGMVSNPSGVGFTPGYENLYSAAFGSIGNFGSFKNSGNALSSMAKNAISGGLSALGSIGSSILSAIFAKRAAKRQFEYNNALMDKQNQMQRDMLVDEMALKMQGYKNAGLSTASLAGNFSNNTAVPSQSVAAPQGTAHDMRLGEVMNAARQVKLQEEAIKSEINLNNAQAEAAFANADVQSQEAYLKRVFGESFYQSEIANKDEDTKKKIAERIKTYQDMWNETDITAEKILNLKQERKNMEQQFDINLKTLPLMCQTMAARAYADWMAGKKSKAEAGVAIQTAKNLGEYYKILHNQVGISEEEYKLLIEQVTAAQHANKENSYRALQAEWAEKLMRDRGYGWYEANEKAKTILEYGERALDDIDKGINVANDAVSLVGNIYTGGIAGNLGTRTTTTGPKGTTVTTRVPFRVQ